MKPRAKTPRRAVPQLSIRSAYAVQRARELARQAGTTTTKIVEEALRDYTPELPIDNDSRSKLKRDLNAIIEEVAKGGPYPSMKEIDDEMYDEWGLPR